MRYLLLLLIVVSCSKEPIATLSIQAAYPSSVCMGSNPSYAVVETDRGTYIFNVKEVRTGRASTDNVQIEIGAHLITDVKVYNDKDEIVSYLVDDFESEWIVTPRLNGWKANYSEGDNKLNFQVVCDAFRAHFVL